jgi:hypothetical protein
MGGYGDQVHRASYFISGPGEPLQRYIRLYNVFLIADSIRRSRGATLPVNMANHPDELLCRSNRSDHPHDDPRRFPATRRDLRRIVRRRIDVEIAALDTSGSG